MMDHVLKKFALFVDGRGYVGDTEEFQPPNLSLKVEDKRLGGMDAPYALDMGMEKLECSFTLLKQCEEVLALFGVGPGTQVPVTARGSLEDRDGTVTAVVMQMRGKIRTIESGAWKSGEGATIKVTIDLTYYKRQQGDRVLHEIDVINCIRVIDGTDILEAHRAACGI